MKRPFRREVVKPKEEVATQEVTIIDDAKLLYSSVPSLNKNEPAVLITATIKSHKSHGVGVKEA